jgi:hypothetical protein
MKWNWMSLTSAVSWVCQSEVRCQGNLHSKHTLTNNTKPHKTVKENVVLSKSNKSGNDILSDVNMHTSPRRSLLWKYAILHYRHKCYFIYANKKSKTFPVTVVVELTNILQHYVQIFNEFHSNHAINVGWKDRNSFTPLSEECFSLRWHTKRTISHNSFVNTFSSKFYLNRGKNILLSRHRLSRKAQELERIRVAWRSPTVMNFGKWIVQKWWGLEIRLCRSVGIWELNLT